MYEKLLYGTQNKKWIKWLFCLEGGFSQHTNTSQYKSCCAYIRLFADTQSDSNRCSTKYSVHLYMGVCVYLFYLENRTHNRYPSHWRLAVCRTKCIFVAACVTYTMRLSIVWTLSSRDATHLHSHCFDTIESCICFCIYMVLTRSLLSYGALDEIHLNDGTLQVV